MLKPATIAALLLALAGAGAASAQTYTPAIARFDGSNGINFAADPALELGKAGTIEFWVQPGWSTAPAEDPVILSYLGATGPLYSIVMTADRKAIGLLSGMDWDLTAFDFTDNKLHHVAFSVAGDVTEVYIDGKYEDTLLVGFGQGAGQSFHIGSLDGIDSPFTGMIAGVRIWDTPLSGAEINSYRLVDILGPQGQKHPDFDALAGLSNFDNGARSFYLQSDFLTRDAPDPEGPVTETPDVLKPYSLTDAQ